MRIIGFLLVFFLISPSYTAQPDKKLHEKCLYPTIQLMTYSSKGSHGTGVIVKSFKISSKEYCNIFLTCNHVSNSEHFFGVRVFEYEKWSRIKDFSTYPAWFYARNPNRDLAIGYFLSDKKMPTADINFNNELFIGSNVARIGCGAGDEPRLDVGKITAFNSKVGMNNCLRTSVHTVPGDSGSPLFDDENKLIAIMIAIRSRGTAILYCISYAVPVEQFKEWSDNWGNSLDFAWSDLPHGTLPIHILRLLNDYSFSRI